LKKFTIEEIRQEVDGVLVGSPTIQITGLEEITAAQADQLTFVGDKKYISAWDESSASAAIVNDNLDIEPGPDRARPHTRGRCRSCHGPGSFPFRAGSSKMRSGNTCISGGRPDS